jgi:Tat protein translocase TatB subunit
MNIFSNLGITEIVVILLLALIVVGPERLPEMGRRLGKTLKDVRRAYDNLTRDLGPEFSSLQESTKDLQESVSAVRGIPQDMVQNLVKVADMEDTIEDLKGMADDVGQVTETLTTAGTVVKNPVEAAVSSARSALQPTEPPEEGDTDAEKAGSQEAPQAAPEAEASPPSPEPTTNAETIGQADAEVEPSD